MSQDRLHTCVIPAAGAGSRLAEAAPDIPKIPLPVGNKPLIAHQFEMHSELGIDRVVLVAGDDETGNRVEPLLPPGMRLETAVQDDPRGIAHSIGILADRIDEPFMVMLGDIFLYRHTLAAGMRVFLDSDSDSIVFVAEKASPDEICKSFAVVHDDEGRVSRVVEKPSYQVSDVRGTGIYLFRTSIFEAIKKTGRSELRNEYELTEAIQLLIESGEGVRTAPAGKRDRNINTPEDLLFCNLYLADKQGRSIIADTAEIHLDAKIIRSVIGPGTRVTQPIEIRNSLIAENVVVDDNQNIENGILFRDTRYACSLYPNPK